MGVYISGMEMPRSCISCHLNFGEKRPEYGLTIYCPYSDGVISWRDKAFDNGRLASCGIIPVPPHGRLGDLDKLENGLRHMAKYQFGERQQGILGCCETIRLASTIIPAEEEI